MKIIISPARTMQVDTDSLPYKSLPKFIHQTEEILAWMRSLSYDELHKVWGNCSTRLAMKNYRWLQQMDLHQNLTPAIIAFTGLQYQYMAPSVFSEDGLKYVEDNLRILSGFYGMLRPFDGIVPYRLGMGDAATVNDDKNLYQFWGDQLYHELYQNNDLVIDLASVEYEKAITPYMQPQDRLIKCVFGEVVDGKVKQKATLAKMARGNMVRYLAENQVKTIEELKLFNIGGYRFRENLSSDSKLIFESPASI
ncbi:peroxide stress protein YaaA [Limosilactobacillus sp. RRLNB_1_1]|uniref:UPF0246 protein H5S40_00465 n=1 Tax=Limosilactobacillus albertensis TaxID=2759752 RepID=A0A7W3TQB0_9LACO|nr:peroxide stress protein YaaA [Limosilactobacillus albertensis]MBB1068676.1 peroxide stress protein YaaA [Limosilactobacillus albertensis]MCD7118267.1 peroxide stress protein YaaA [Limosilactobacillus albertensis]MCD7127435.1 peroxide stress protein YaaA [Limosilactobacillus albertensis]